MNIIILASIGAENLGDELILKNEIKMLEKQFFNKKPVFAVFTYDTKNIFYKKNNIEYLEYFPFGIRKPKNIFRNIKNFWMFLKTIIVSDLVVIGGGGIFFDNEKSGKNSNLSQWIFRTKIIRFFKKNILFWGVGINIFNEKNLKKLKKIFSKAYNITVRDDFSKETLKKIGIKSKLIKDPVFFDSFEEEKKYTNAKINLQFWKNYQEFSLENLEKINFEGKKVGIAFRRGYLSKEKIEKLLEYILKKKGEIFLIPHSFHRIDKNSNDYIFLKNFININKLQEKKIYITKNIDESYGIYKNKKIDFNFCMRLHSIILSEVYNIDFIGISYTKKTEEILRQIENK